MDKYYSKEEFLDDLIEQIIKPVRDNKEIVSTLVQEAYEVGVFTGREDAYEEGYKKGHQEGFEEAYDIGYDSGYVDGLEDKEEF